jgi:hypothetical protein
VYGVVGQGVKVGDLQLHESMVSMSEL